MITLIFPSDSSTVMHKFELQRLTIANILDVEPTMQHIYILNELIYRLKCIIMAFGSQVKYKQPQVSHRKQLLVVAWINHRPLTYINWSLNSLWNFLYSFHIIIIILILESLGKSTIKWLEAVQFKWAECWKLNMTSCKCLWFVYINDGQRHVAVASSCFTNMTLNSH